MAANQQVKRRLATIVASDVVGYSRHMESDEAGTVARLKSMRNEIVHPQTARFHGRIVDTAGDGWLAEFASVTDALQSSIAIQDAMQERNAGLTRDARFDIRIGINLGEVICEGDAIYGTGVNVAARLEALAAPGGICISESVHDHMQGVPDVACDDMGEQTVKNISRPVRCYALRLEPRRRVVSGAGGNRVTPGASIAVLPFADLSSGKDQEYFADGMVEDIITALSRFRRLFVIARNSSFVFKHRAVDIRQVALELGVRYVLEGSVRREAGRIRLTAQLIDASSGGHLWAERFDGDLADVFDLQDRITEKVVGAIEPQIRRAEIERARRKHPQNLEAYDRFLQGLPLVYAMRPADCAQALALFRQVLDLDPRFTPAAAYAAWCYEQSVVRGWPTARPGDAEEAVRLVREVLRSDTDDENAIAVAGFVLFRLSDDIDTGLRALRRAMELNPNNAFVAMNAGWANIFAGDIDEAMTLLERARAVSPADPTAFYVLSGLGMGHALQGRYEEAVALAGASAALYGDWDATYGVLAFANAHLGRLDDARAAAAKLQSLLPGITVTKYKDLVRFRDPARLAVVQEGLRLAGLPE
jgi:TolB-like protein/class 3 adenylate cyclase/Flp pilus assembly protein TadD